MSGEPERFRELPVSAFARLEDWINWIDSNQNATGIWIKFAKKASGIPSITYMEAREGALMYGWIDGQVYKFDAHYYLQRFTPRTKTSGWSKINCRLVEELIAAGKMKPAGLAAVAAAKADGRWDNAYDAPSTITVPSELQAALNADTDAAEAFANLSKSNRYAILYRIHTAKRPETKARQIAKAIEMLRQGQTYHP